MGVSWEPYEPRPTREIAVKYLADGSNCVAIHADIGSDHPEGHRCGVDTLLVDKEGRPPVKPGDYVVEKPRDVGPYYVPADGAEWESTHAPA